MADATECFLGLGGNLPFAGRLPIETLAAAVPQLELAGLRILAVSAAYGSAPVPASDQPDFTNAALKAETTLSAEELLGICKSVERLFGREPGSRWSARTLDVDILAYGDQVVPHEAAWRQAADGYDPADKPDDLVVPHPRLHKRAFALAPLADIAPDWHHPVLGKTARRLLADVHADAPHDTVTRLSAAIW